MERAGHAAQNGSVDVVRAVGCADYDDSPGRLTGEAVPQRHELRLDVRTRLVVCRCPRLPVHVAVCVADDV